MSVITSTITDSSGSSTLGTLTTSLGHSSYSGDPRGFVGSQGINFTGTVWGATIPISAGYRKVDGFIVWAGPLIKDYDPLVTTPALAGVPSSFSTQEQTWSVKRTFAVSIGKRMDPSAPAPLIRRVWADGKLVYANGQGVPLNYKSLQHDYTSPGQYLNGLWIPNPGTDGQEPLAQANAEGKITGVVVPYNPVMSNITFRFHDGNEDQLPDQAIVDDLGDLAPAFRGQMTLVIEGLVMGKGYASHSNLSAFGGPDADIDNQFTFGDAFPQISVELVDGNDTIVTGHDFTMLPTATVFGHPSEVVLANWDSRELAVFSFGVGGNKLHIFDMDSATQTICVAVTGSADNIGGSLFGAWDTQNDVLFTGKEHSTICSVGRDGVIISAVMDPGFNIGPGNIGGPPFTDADPATTFPQPQMGTLDYLLTAGALLPVILAGTDWVGAYCPSAAGVLPPSLGPREFFQTHGGSGNNLESCVGMKLAAGAVKNAHTSYQDVAFVIAYGTKVEIVYVTAAPAGGLYRCNILGRNIIYTATDPDAVVRAIVDNAGNVAVQEFKVATPTKFTKIKINLGEPDYALAPGWRGNFPIAAGVVIDHVQNSETVPWEGNALANSDIGANTIGSTGGAIVNLDDGSVNTITGFDGLDSTTSVWDSPNNVRYFHGNITDPAFGHGMKFAQVFSGITGEVNQLKNVLRDFGHMAGYVDADLDIDSSLIDEIPGVLVTHPYDLTTLFTDIGAIYNFTYFNSGHKLKFARADNSPVKAGGGCTFTSTTGMDGLSVLIADGDTATIGTFVYRFKTTPSQPFDVKIGADTQTAPSAFNLDAKEKTCANFLAAIMGDLSLAASDAQDPTDAPGFFAGTLPNTFVVAKATKSGTDNFGFDAITLTAIFGGPQGNAIATTSSATHFSFVHPTLVSGANPPDATLSLTVDDMLHVSEQQLSDNDSLITTIAPFGQGQQSAAVTYYALEQDYMPAQQTFIPDDQNGELGKTGNTAVTYALPFVMSTSEAYGRVAKAAIVQADNVVTQNFRLPQAYLLLEPSDVLAITLPPFAYTVRLDEATFNADFSTSFSAINYTFRNDVEIADSDSQSRLPQTVASPSDCLPVVIDAPLLNPLFGTPEGTLDLFNGVRAYKIGFGAGNLSAAKLSLGLPGATASLFNTSHDVRWGTIVGTLPEAEEPFMLTREESVTVSCKTILPTGDLASAAYADFVAGVNCIAYGRPGAWEYIFFRDVTVVNAKTVTLSGLIRGQRGTEVFANTHEASDVVLLLTSAAPGFAPNPLRPQSLPLDQIDVVYRYSASGTPATRSASSVDITVEGLPLYPFAPCHLTATLAGGNDIDVAWVRRDRLSTAFVTDETPLNEASELYDLEIMDGATIKRTVTGLSSPAYVYTSAQQSADGFTPPLATLKVNVYQRSISIGRGFVKTETVNVG